MFKTKEEVIVIQAEATDPITTGVVFWSHDKGTAKLLFQLKKGTVSQTLAEGTIVPICLVFNGGRHIYHAVIEDAVNGIVSIVLEDNILGYVGRVEGSIYIELPDSRSLDTAGRFTFQIKRSPIDEDVPELENYYWQGFNEIMNQYHQTITEIKSEAKALLDSLTADVTTAKTKVTQLEQSITTANTNLNARIDEISKKIDDNDVFTKAESSANVIYQLIGKEEVELTVTFNYLNKTAGSIVENKNVGCLGIVDSLPKPEQVTYEMPQTNYEGLKTLNDKKTSDISSNSNGKRVYECFKYYIYDDLVTTLGETFFEDRGATSKSDKIRVLKENLITKLESEIYGLGSGPSGAKLTTQVWSSAAQIWYADVSHSSSSIQKLTNSISGQHLKNYIDDEGYVYVIASAEKSDGISSSSAKIDFSQLNAKLRISANEHIKLMIAANRVENLATQEEAVMGEDNTKTMTPATTAQAIDHRAVTLASNQTVGGIKNFKDGLQVAGKNLVRTNGLESAYADKNSTPESFSDGTLNLYRKGDTVFLTGSIKLSAGKKNQGIWVNLPSWAKPLNMVRLFFRSTNGNMVLLTYDPITYDALVCVDNVEKDQWLIGSGTWLAKDSY